MATHRRLPIGWLIALIFLAPVGGTALYVAVFRMADCPQEIHQREFGWAWGKYRCFRCQDRGRITILNRWLDGQESLDYWEGMEVSTVSTVGLQKLPRAQVLDIAGLRSGMRMTHQVWKDASLRLWKSERFDNVGIRVQTDPASPGKVVVTIDVNER